MYPEDPLFHLGNRREGTGDDYADVNKVRAEVVSPEKENVDSNITNAPSSFANATTETTIPEEEPELDENSTSKEKKLDLFNKPRVPSPPEQQQQQPTVIPTKAILVELLDFELTLTFMEPQRLLRSHSTTRHQHRQTQIIQARNAIVRETLTTFLNELYANELYGRRYAPLDQVVVNNGENERVIVSKSSITSELYDLSSTSAWSGVTIFRKFDEGQRIPTDFTVQAIQLQGLADESGTLFSALREAGYRGIAGLDQLQSIKASILPSSSLSYDANRIIESELLPMDSAHSENRPPARFDTVVFIALIIASLSFALLATTLFIAYRRSQASPLHPRKDNSKYDTKASQWKLPDARPDELPPNSSGGFITIASSASPVEGVQINTDGEDADDEMSLPTELPASVDPADGASVSAFSDVSSLGNVIQDATQTYQNNVGNHSTCTTPDSRDTFFHRFTSGRNEEESVGVVSIDDSSQLGALSVAGIK